MEDILSRKVMADKDIFLRAFKYIKPHYKKFIISFLLLIINVALEIVIPILVTTATGEMKNEIINFNIILTCVLTYISLGIINVVFVYIQSVLLRKTGQEIILTLREDVFNHIENLSISQFNNVPVGKLVSRVINDTITLSDLFSTVLVNLIKNILLVVGTFSVMIFVSWKLSLLVLVFSILIFIFSMIFRKVSKIVFAKEREELSLMNGFIAENVNGMKVTQVFNQEKRKIDEFAHRNKEVRKAANNVSLTFACYRPLISLLHYLAIAACFAVGIPMAFNGEISGETFYLFYIYLFHFFGPIQQISEQLNNLQRGLTSSERIFNILDIKSPIIEDKNAIEIDSFKGNIVFDHVWFAYTDENWILKDVSFEINAGETIAFVGKTGAGKTTILSLIVRNYDIQKGKIYIDGIDITKIKLSSLRRCIGQMLQDVFLFSGTIKSNIRLRNEEISDEEIIKSCKYVNADRFIDKLSNKYDEEIKENGSNLSNGERQLLSFARVIVRNPSILILDEATANIDTETEVLIQESLEKMKNIGTMLIVAHRLSTIRNADRIIVIEDGKIIESGSHDELMKLGGHYANLCLLSEN